LATITGRTVSSLLPPCDTPPAAGMLPDISRAELGRVIPAASRRIRDQREALRAGLDCPDLAEARADFRAHLAAWWRIHVGHSSWGGPGKAPRGTTQPTRARVCELAGFSISTYKACRRWWEARGYVAIVRRGWTPALRAAVLTGPGDHNERQVYVLCVPRKYRPARPGDQAQPVTRPLTWSRRDLVRNPAHARGNPAAGPAPDQPRTPRSWPLGGISDGWWASLTRPFAVAGWTLSDLTWAIDHEPGGRQHRHRLAYVRHPAGWLRWRLAHWLTPDGTPAPSRSARLAAAAAARRAETAAWRQAQAELAAGRSADYAGHAARARAMLADRRAARAARPGPVTAGGG
jgi:hypothetical protein